MSPLYSPYAPRALFVYPNKELVKQTFDVLGNFKHDWRLKCSRGNSFTMEKEALSKGVDIFLSTPDRIEEHILKKSLNFSGLEYFIIDEFNKKSSLLQREIIRQIYFVSN